MTNPYNNEPQQPQQPQQPAQPDPAVLQRAQLEEQIIYPLLPVNMLVGGGFCVFGYAVVYGGFRWFPVTNAVELHGRFGGLFAPANLTPYTLGYPRVGGVEPVAVLNVLCGSLLPRVSGDFSLPCCPTLYPHTLPPYIVRLAQ